MVDFSYLFHRYSTTVAAKRWQRVRYDQIQILQSAQSSQAQPSLPDTKVALEPNISAQSSSFVELSNDNMEIVYCKPQLHSLAEPESSLLNNKLLPKISENSSRYSEYEVKVPVPICVLTSFALILSYLPNILL